MLRILGYLALFLFVSGCFPAGRDFPTYPVAEIKPNATTKAQIFANFGEPYERGLESGYETWTYYYVVYTIGGLQTRKQLDVTFNQDGTVRSYNYRAK